MSKLFGKITGIIIGILAFLLVVTMGMTIAAISEDLNPYEASESSLLYALQDERYSDLIRYYHRNQALEVKATKTMEECYAVARYYEAALDYNVFVRQQDEELQPQALAAMEEAAGQMGDFSYLKEDIDERLELLYFK